MAPFQNAASFRYCHVTGWRRLIGSPKLPIIFHKRATKYMSLLRKMTYKDKGSYESWPPCSHVPCIWLPYLIFVCATTLSYFSLGLFVRIPSPVRSLGRFISKCCIFLVFMYAIWLVCSNACPMTHAHNFRDSFKCTPSPICNLRRPIPTCCIFLVFV